MDNYDDEFESVGSTESLEIPEDQLLLLPREDDRAQFLNLHFVI